MQRTLCPILSDDRGIPYSMPFTPTHTLAAVPFAWWLSGPAVFSSMVIGCMVPDWPLYVPFGPSYALTHSAAGIVIACLPIGLALSVFFQVALKRPLSELLPAYFQARLTSYVENPQKLSPRVLLTMSGAVLLGAASHVLWDAFTHRGMWGVATFPALNEVLFAIGDARFRTYMVLQHGSTIVGFPLFLILFGHWCKSSEVRNAAEKTLSARSVFFWRTLLMAIPLVMSAQMIWNLFQFNSPRGVFGVLYFGVTQAGLMFLVAFSMLGVQYLWVSRGASD